MKILVTGGAGFIGSHTADALLSEGHSVRVLDSLEEPVHRGRQVPTYLDSRIDFVLGDVRDEATLLGALDGCEAVYHFAAFQDYLPTFSKFFEVNVTSTARIYELAVRERLPLEKIIVASSQATLGEGYYEDADGRKVRPGLRSNEQLAAGIWEHQPSPGQKGPLRWRPTDETFSNPQNPYGMSKIAEESVALNLGRQYGIPTVAMRYSIVQGPRQSFYNAYSGACRVFSLSFKLGREPVLYEDGQQVRDFVNIHDVVDANLMALSDPRMDYEMFHVGGDNAVTVAEFAQVVADVFGYAGYEPTPSGKYRYGDTRHICSDVRKLKALGWRPNRSVVASVEAYRAWLEKADVGEEILDYCNNQMAKLGVVRDISK